MIWTTGDTINTASAFLTFLAIVVALILGIRSIRTTKKIQQREHMTTLLNEVLQWTTDAFSIIPAILSIEARDLGVITSPEIDKWDELIKRSEYIKPIATLLDKGLNCRLANSVEEVIIDINDRFRVLIEASLDEEPVHDKDELQRILDALPKGMLEVEDLSERGKLILHLGTNLFRLRESMKDLMQKIVETKTKLISS